MKARTLLLVAGLLTVGAGVGSLAAQNIGQTSFDVIAAGQTVARWVNTAADSNGPFLRLGNTLIAWGPGADFSANAIQLTAESSSAGTVIYELQGEAADTYEILAMPDGDVTTGHWSYPANGAGDAVTTGGDNVLMCERVYFPMWLTVANVYARAVVASDSSTDDTLSFAIYNDADAGTQVTEGEGADSTTSENVTIDVTDVTIGPGMYRFCGCAQDVSGVAFHAETRDDEYIDVINEDTVTYGTAANACVAGNPPATTGALTTADDNMFVFKLAS